MTRAIGTLAALLAHASIPSQESGFVEIILPQVAAKLLQDDGGRYLRPILNAIPLGIGILAPDGTILDANRRVVERYRLQLEEMRGRLITDVYPWSSSLELQTKLRTALVRAAGGESVRFELEVPTPYGRPVLGEAWLTPITSETGCVTHLIFSEDDRTE